MAQATYAGKSNMNRVKQYNKTCNKNVKYSYVVKIVKLQIVHSYMKIHMQ